MRRKLAVVVSCSLGLACGAPAGGGLGPGDVPLMCVSQDHEFRLGDLRGRFVALHFMPGVGTAEHDTHVRQYLESAPERAGVVHVFVSSGDSAALKSWWAPLDRAGAMGAHDAGGRLAGEFNIRSGPGEPCALVVLDREGRELFRHVGDGPHDHMPFAAFAARLDETGRPRAVDEYNLPRDTPLAVKGYDAVSYFTEGRAVKGTPRFTSVYLGVRYRFASAEHRDRFAAAPERYAPAYGGWCASAMGDGGRKVGIDPTNFKVKDGRLFLFYKSLTGDALKDWNRREKEWEPAADEHWKRISGEGR